ncbi:hypothetical protein P7L91_02385 [Bisgaard Taxon 10/6]|nr:hypothetical protein [Exercitatus varius]
MAQKLLKYELVKRLLQLKEKQDLLTVQMQLLTREISELAAPFMPIVPKDKSVITTRLVTQVLKESQGVWLMRDEGKMFHSSANESELTEKE